VIAVGGRVASGKTQVSRTLAERLDAEHVEADRIREGLLGRGPAADTHEASWERNLRPLLAQETYAELRRRTEHALAAGRDVVVDACFPREAQREGVRSLARDVGASFLFVECHADASVTQQRLTAREAHSGPGWTEIAAELARTWEPVAALSAVEHLRLHTGRPLQQAVADALAHLAARRPPPPASGDAVPLRVDAVTFDCWSTLIFESSWQEAHARRVAALAQAAREAGRSVSNDEAGVAFDAAWEHHMRLWREGVASGAQQVAVSALAGLGLRAPHPALDHLTRSFQEASHSEGVVALPGAGDTLERLAQAGVRRALICDTGLTPGRVVRTHLERLGLLPLLEVQVFSDEIGVPKPDPRAFMAALEPLATAPQRALHVGDLRRTDVAGARSVGMATARIHAHHDDTSPLPEADYAVGSHAALQALLGERVAAG
jgi:FMN phosphatase YigB (HAD superfamily)/predicted kinase